MYKVCTIEELTKLTCNIHKSFIHMQLKKLSRKCSKLDSARLKVCLACFELMLCYLYIHFLQVFSALNKIATFQMIHNEFRSGTFLWLYIVCLSYKPYNLSFY